MGLGFRDQGSGFKELRDWVLEIECSGFGFRN